MPHPRHLFDTCGTDATPAPSMRHLRHLFDTCGLRRDAPPLRDVLRRCGASMGICSARARFFCAKSRVYYTGVFLGRPQGAAFGKRPLLGEYFLARRQVFCPRLRDIRFQHLSVVGSSIHTNYVLLSAHFESSPIPKTIENVPISVLETRSENGLDFRGQQSVTTSCRSTS